MDLVIRNARLPGAEGCVDIGVIAGIIHKIGAPDSLTSPRVIDAKGGLVSPPFVDPHVHLDAVLTAGDPRHNSSGTLLEGIRIWGERKQHLSVEDIKARAYRAISWMVAQGVLFVRTHADVSEPTLTTVQSLIELREELRGLVDIQVVAFPQDGIYTNDDGERLMEEAIELGVDAIGCIPHNEFTREDGIASVEYVMGLASETGLLVDIHCDETDDEQSRFIETVAAQAIKRGLQGRVAASHATAMHSYNNAYAAKLIGLLARAGVGVITNPFDNSILQARGDSYPKRRGITRVDELLEAGVAVGIGHDSIMDPWYPLGRGSMLQAASLLLHLAQLSGREQIRDVFRMITSNSAKILNIDDRYGIEEGKPATFVVLNAENEREAIRLMPECLYVVRDGRVLAQTEPALSTVQLTAGKQIVDFRAPAPSSFITPGQHPATDAVIDEEPA
ncbi:MAG: cytosine deaminase [Oceanidesulfovibrio sp.]